MTEMETKILASIESIKNEMNEIKTEQDAMKKQISTIKQVFSLFKYSKFYCDYN